MAEPLQVFWAPEGANLPSLGSRALVDVTDGDTPNLRMPVRMLSVDTPEVTARSPERARAIDQEFRQLSDWIDQGRAPIDAALGEYMRPKLAGGQAGTLQYEQGKQASAFEKQNMETRLRRPDGSCRNMFIRVADAPFDDNHRLLAYLAPAYGKQELQTLPREQRHTFNLDLVTNGWAVPFVIYPSIPGATDLRMLVEAAATARAEGRGIWSDANTLLAYEYRATERLYAITKRKVGNEPVEPQKERSWRERYCADMRTRVLHGPEDYFRVEPEYRLWIWPQDIREAVGRLNLVPSTRLTQTNDSSA